MPRNRLLALALIIAIGGLAALEGRRANAIPAFARKYQLSCSTCHAPFPRLKPFGEEFAGRGFRMEDRSKEPTRATYDVGDPLLMLSRELPLAVRIEGYASWKDDGASRTDFEWPWAAKLLSGGPITKNVSYYFYGILEQGESIKLEDTFIQFNSVFNLPIDVLAGQFQVSDPLFKREPRLERNDYSIFRLAVGEVPTNLTYDRGIVLTWHAPAAIDVVGQVVNGNGIDPARDDNFDDNSLKHYSLRVVRWFGPVRAGIFGHRGRTGPEGGFKDAITYLGPDLVIDLGDKAQLDLEYLRRTDDDPFLDGRSGSDLVSKGGLRSFIASPRAWTAVGWSACSTTTWIPTPRRPAPRTPQ
ncbi:MAG: hypothetical protein ACM3O7_03200 [Acidobacteriota bacterium]